MVTIDVDALPRLLGRGRNARASSLCDDGHRAMSRPEPGSLWRQHVRAFDAVRREMREARGIADVPWSSLKRLLGVSCVSAIYTSWILSPVMSALAVWRYEWLRAYVACYLFASYALGVAMPMNALHRFFCWLETGEENGWQLVVEDDCDVDCSKRAYLFTAHPHGLFASGCVGNVVLSGRALKRFRARRIWFFINELLIRVFPIIKDVLSMLGFVPCTAKMMKKVLGRGETGLIVVGGVQEVVLTGNVDEEELYLKNCFGFVKVAMQAGTPLVPVYTFGESLATGPDWVPFRELRKRLSYKFVFPFRSLGIIHRWGLCFPKAKLTTVVGAPIKVKQNPNPTREEVAAVHQQYCDALLAMIERNKARAGYPTQRTKLV